MPTILILGVAIPALLYTMIMVLLGWSAPVLGGGGAKASFKSTDATLYLYESPSTRLYFEKVSGDYENLLNPWRSYFNERKRSVKVLTRVEDLKSLSPGVVVLPSAVALTQEERSHLAAFRAAGGSILATWATGTRNGSGGWVGWDFLEQLGAKNAKEQPAGEESRQLVLTGESPVSHTLGAGHRYWLEKSSETLIKFSAELHAGRLMNWARTPLAEQDTSSAIVYSESGETSARAVVLGFAESSWESRPFAMQQMIDDAVRWLMHEPVAIKAVWPHGKRAAQVIEMDAEEGFENAANLALQLKQAKLPATFYVLTSSAIAHPQVLRDLASSFEIGLHGDVHDSFKGQAATEQSKRIVAMKNELATLLPTLKPSGFRAPTEGYDLTTEMILSKNGFTHHAADPARSDARLPLFAKLPDSTHASDLVILPRTQRDDINLLKEGVESDYILQALIADANEAINTGSLGWLSVHSQNLKTDSPLSVAFPAYLKHLKANEKRVWFATAGEVADWWRQREDLKVESLYSGRRMDLNLTLKGEQTLKGASIMMMLPQKRFVPTVRGAKINMELPTVKVIGDYRAVLVFPALNPGNHSYQVTFAQQVKQSN